MLNPFSASSQTPTAALQLSLAEHLPMLSNHLRKKMSQSERKMLKEKHERVEF